MAQKSWAVGEEVLAADFNLYIQNQVVPQFTSTAQRDSQWTSPPNGALCVTVDTNTLWQRVNGTWQHTGAGAHMGSQFSTADAGMYPSTGNLLVVVFTALAGHRYQYLANCQYGQTAAGGGAMTQNLRDGGTDLTVRSITYPAGNCFFDVTSLAIATPSAGAHTIAILGTAVNAGLYFQDGWLVVTDLGLTTQLGATRPAPDPDQPTVTPQGAN